MSKGPNQRLKLLYLARIFLRETDAEHALDLKEITELLEGCGVTAERKTLYTDFEELRRYGLDIRAEHRGRDTCYYLAARDFELPELKLLVDSVQQAKFLTERKSRELIRKLEALASRHQAQQLHRQVIISGRVKTMNERIYANVDKLHEAINAGVQIRFQYYQWNVRKELEPRRRGQSYQVSPWCLTWDDENYYLVAYDAAEARLKHYRVDKMQRIALTAAERLGGDVFSAADLPRYTRGLFRMYGGEEVSVTLEGENALVGVLIDRFGKDIWLEPCGPDRFRAVVEVAVSPHFFGWIMGLGGGVRVVGPEPVVEQLRAEVRRLAREYLGEA